MMLIDQFPPEVLVRDVVEHRTRGHPPVDQNNLAVDQKSFVGAQERRHVADVVGLDEAPVGDMLQGLGIVHVDDPLERIARELGVGNRGADAIDAHAMAVGVLGDALAQRVDAILGSAVSPLVSPILL